MDAKSYTGFVGFDRFLRFDRSFRFGGLLRFGRLRFGWFIGRSAEHVEPHDLTNPPDEPVEPDEPDKPDKPVHMILTIHEQVSYQ
jgi:hypothetical protein